MAQDPREHMHFPGKENWQNEKAIYTAHALLISEHQVMMDWETPYMRQLAEIATSGMYLDKRTPEGLDILEIGFGMGISAKFIQEDPDVRTHTIIECNLDVQEHAKNLYAKEIAEGRIILKEGYWEKIVPLLADKSFDGILFDSYPLDVKEIHKNHFSFFQHAFRLLTDFGVLTYYSDEERNYSPEHVRVLEEAGFSKRELRSFVCKIEPPPGCQYWDKPSLMVPVVPKPHNPPYRRGWRRFINSSYQEAAAYDQKVMDAFDRQFASMRRHAMQQALKR